ncbi:MAG: potassium channel protein, partial [Thermoplasmatales archaeon]|nr:potassium channel protein [Thermoplasmatales archaeon]
MKEKTAEDIVLEIKDKSELMVDLAYSSVLYDNKTIAEEVYDLENLVDNLYRALQKKSLEDVKNGEHSIDDALTLLRIAHAGEQIADAAQEIADVELRDVESHPILKMSIRESDVVFTRVEVDSQSILCGKTLGQLKLASETGMMVIAMRHKDKWLYGPNKNTKIDL